MPSPKRTRTTPIRRILNDRHRKPQLPNRADPPDLAGRIAAIASEILKVEVDPNRHDASFAEDYGADSMDIVDLTDRIEREFRITIPTEDITDIKTFGAFVGYLRTQLGSI